ncbi:DUF5753 domain-containing protein [Nocardia callitridis]|uniref:Helix-turn-helix transcriptional regulator n=1 Tax=Nocardia callitridis TaxID=648753 RepID=A0ABP9KDP8_9NOCA
MARTSPTVAGWELMLRVREQLATRGLKANQVSKALDISGAYWSQVANYKGLLTEDKLSVLLDLLEFEPPEREELMQLREAAKGPNPYAEFSALFDDSLKRFYGLEDGAQSIRSFESSVIPGLLQTEDYIRVLMKAAVTTGRPTEVEPRVRARKKRQNRLDGPDPLQLSVVVGQAALMCVVGGPEVQRAQLRHLQELVEAHPHTLDLRIIPFDAGGSLASLNAATFHLLDFNSARLPTIGWLETAIYGEIADSSRHVEALEYLYSQVQAIALDQADSLKLIDQIARQIG